MFQGKPQLIAFFASLAMSLGLCQIALAACGTAYCSDTIGTLYVAEGNVYIRPTNGTSGLTNCTVNGAYLTLSTSDPQYASYYALLLAAQMSGQSITIRTQDGSSVCAVAYITIP